MNKLNKTDLQKFINSAKKVKIAVIGDLMLDSFEYGTSTRLSPEAPVPVILIDKIDSMPGGAANVIINIKHLGATPIAISTTGDDDDGKTLRRILEKEKISTAGIFSNKKVTISKKRILLDEKHFARIDKEIIKPSTKDEEQKVISYFKKNLSKIDCVVFSDYAKGLLTKKIITEISKLANKKKIPIVVDTKPSRAHLYKSQKITLIKPNEKEACEMSKTENLLEAGKYLQKYFSSAVVVSRGGDGMTLFENEKIVHVEGLTKNAVDVSGCGDTVIAFLATSLATESNLTDATHLSNYAANIAVQKKGTSTVTPKELINVKFK